jgi:hypothetical protein
MSQLKARKQTFKRRFMWQMSRFRTSWHGKRLQNMPRQLENYNGDVHKTMLPEIAYQLSSRLTNLKSSKIKNQQTKI